MATTVTSSVPRVGEAATDFSLDSTAGSPIRLSDHRGQRNVLLAFFPLAFTSTCPADVCEFSNDFDFRRDVSRLYGVLDEDRFFVPRAYLLIDQQGVLRWTHVEEQLGHKRGTDELLKKIEELD